MRKKEMWTIAYIDYTSILGIRCIGIYKSHDEAQDAMLEFLVDTKKEFIEYLKEKSGEDVEFEDEYEVNIGNDGFTIERRGYGWCEDGRVMNCDIVFIEQ